MRPNQLSGREWVTVLVLFGFTLMVLLPLLWVILQPLAPPPPRVIDVEPQGAPPGGRIEKIEDRLDRLEGKP